MGLDAAKGEYITFIDDDDWCEPDYLEFLYALALENTADIAICGAADKALDVKEVMLPEEALIDLLWRKKYNVAFPAKLFKAALFNEIRFSPLAKYDDIELMPRIIARARRVAYYGLPKYTFVRHTHNNSAWTTNHGLLDAATLAEYLAVYRSRTEWLIEVFPKNTPAWRYFEWSFMISMVEKIYRLQIKNCEQQRENMMNVLRDNYTAFFQCGLALDFEKEWMMRYVQSA